MTTSIFEQILVAAEAALTDAGLAVERSREDAFSEDELPTRKLRRVDSPDEVLADRVSKYILTFDVEHYAAVSSGWETVVDAMHMQTHAALLNNATLKTLGRGLRCIGTEMQGASAEYLVGQLTAHYQIQVLTTPGDLTRSIT